MDYSKIIQDLQQATLFDLYRLNVAISQQLENPKRIAEIRDCLKPGQVIRYFSVNENRLIEATVLKLMRTQLSVRHNHNLTLWTIPFSSVNLNNVDTDLVVPTKMGLEKSQLKVGDIVVYPDRQNNDVHGQVIRLNPKTATIKTDAGAQWRVGYEWLSLVIDGERASPRLIEGRISKTVENR